MHEADERVPRAWEALVCDPLVGTARQLEFAPEDAIMHAWVTPSLRVLSEGETRSERAWAEALAAGRFFQV